MGSFEIRVIETVPNIRIVVFEPNKDGAVTVAIDNKGNADYPSELELIPLYLVPKSIKKIKNRRRNVLVVPAACRQISIETTDNLSKGTEAMTFLCLRVRLKIERNVKVRHFDCYVLEGRPE